LIIVLDTNVLVSGLKSPYGPPARIVDQVISSEIRVAFDDRIVAEYIDVLTRGKFSFDPYRVHAIVDHIKLVGLLAVGRPLGIVDPPDPTDLPFAEVAVSARVDALVTGNRAHFGFLKDHGIDVLSPTEFLEVLDRLA
jgi:putative PIN family toxin of toxin-antitoxin system